MYNPSDSLYFERWDRLKPLPIEFVRTNEFNGVSQNVVVTSAGDFGVHAGDKIEIKSACFKARDVANLAKFWFSTNMNSNLINHEVLPLGVANPISIEHINRNLGNSKDILLYCNFNPDTNREIRPAIKQIFSIYPTA